MELLAGARSDQDYDLVRSLVSCVDWLGIDPASDFAAAAQIYGACRGWADGDSGVSEYCNVTGLESHY